jgi:TatD DNase family protein
MHGLGELGLDARPAYRDSLPKQELAFRAQLRLARRFDAPLILHIVREHSLALRVLREEGVPARGGIVHSFSGGAREAQAYVELGLLLSVSGGNFRGGDRRVRQAAARVPADSWLVETDSPDQKHPDWPGEWSMPARLVDVATRLGAVLERGAEDVLASSTEQVRRVFGV